MNLIENLRDRCDAKRNETNDEKYELISKILSDDDCFFIIDMDVAIDILSSLDIANPLDYYRRIISYEEMEKDKIRVVD